jgi:hypothetical protein
MSLPAAPRGVQGSAHGLSERVRVYWTEKALEVDSSEGYEIRRRRVFFDEILLVTLHSKPGGALPWLPFGLAALVGLTSASMWSEPSVRDFLMWTAGGLFVAGVLVYFTPLWIITVFGRRTRARVQYRLREKKARDLFARICRAAAEAQGALSAQGPTLEPAPEPPPLPLSASDPPVQRDDIDGQLAKEAR